MCGCYIFSQNSNIAFLILNSHNIFNSNLSRHVQSCVYAQVTLPQVRIQTYNHLSLNRLVLSNFFFQRLFTFILNVLIFKYLQNNTN